MSALQHLSLCAAQAGLARGDFSALELTEAILAAIGRVDERVGAYVEVQADDARAQACAADERRAAGDPAPLLGLPLA
ncbi:MAG: Asp-tRNA(Asn)/Glu-tRNA(Gln) amidotransferase subunit GatA, partial [Candidatus Marinimicrobia bacterium]|nr:Asp-tRNA(Asn)/Glu-tRNA(Gln) amidotransferase subunit GatA [Candidatus Neomarinimicrobiota bacterium]